MKYPDSSEKCDSEKDNEDANIEKIMNQRYNSYKNLQNFVIEARKQGFADDQIKKPLLENGWPLEEIDKAIASVKITSSSGPQYKIKNRMEIYLTEEVLKALEKRAEKNMFNLNEQIEDILRRSCLHEKQIKAQEDKVDDLFLKLFSRKRE